MNKYYKIILLALFAIYTTSAFSIDFPSTILDEGNLRKIHRELTLTKEWRTAKVDGKEFIIPYLIRTKNVKVLRYLLDRDIKILFHDIKYAAKIFFNLEIKNPNTVFGLDFTMINKFILLPETPCEQLLSSINDMHNKDDIIEYISPILNMFFEPKEITDTLVGLYWGGHIDQRTLNLFAFYGDGLLMDKNHVSSKSVIKFVENFHTKDACLLSLLKLLINSYETSLAHKPITMHVIPEVKKAKNKLTEHLAYGLTELSKTRLLDISLRLIAQKHEDPQETEEFRSWIEFNRALKNYVVTDITIHNRHEEKLEAFEFWSQIAQILVDNDNLSDATIIQSALKLSLYEFPKRVKLPTQLNFNEEFARKLWVKRAEAQEFHIPLLSTILAYAEFACLDSENLKTFKASQFKKMHDLKNLFLATKRALLQKTFSVDPKLIKALKALVKDSIELKKCCSY